MHTTTFSSLTAQSSFSHYLLADDTQRFTSFIHKNFTTSIFSVESAIASISFWMTANFLTLNHSKTEFMLIDLPRQLSKIHNPSFSLNSVLSISLPILLASSASYSTPLFPPPNKCLHYPAPVTTTSMIFLALDIFWTSKLLLLLSLYLYSFILSTATPFTTISLTFSSIAFNLPVFKIL